MAENDNSHSDDLFEIDELNQQTPSNRSVMQKKKTSVTDDEMKESNNEETSNGSNAQSSKLQAPKMKLKLQTKSTDTNESEDQQTVAIKQDQQDPEKPAVETRPEKQAEKAPEKQIEESIKKISEPGEKKITSGLKIYAEKKSIKIIGSISTENASVGQILQEARVCLNLSLNQVEQQTKIKKTFLEAVERDDYNNLPALCYVSAYTKTLCQLYKIDAETSTALLAKLKEKKSITSVPSELLQTLENDKHTNIEQEKKLKKMALITTTLILIPFLIILAIYVYPSDPENSGHENKTDSLPVYFKSVELEKFIPNLDIYITELPLEEK